MERFNISYDNIYNWDEKGFLIGQASATQRIMSRKALKESRIKYAYQNSSREFIILLAYISATGVALPPSFFMPVRVSKTYKLIRLINLHLYTSHTAIIDGAVILMALNS